MHVFHHDFVLVYCPTKSLHVCLMSRPRRPRFVQTHVESSSLSQFCKIYSFDNVRRFILSSSYSFFLSFIHSFIHSFLLVYDPYYRHFSLFSAYLSDNSFLSPAHTTSHLIFTTPHFVTSIVSLQLRSIFNGTQPSDFLDIKKIVPRIVIIWEDILHSSCFCSNLSHLSAGLLLLH